MKVKVILSAIVFGAATFAGYAQTGIQSGTPFGKGQDSIRCVQNLSLLASYAKQGDYKSAVEFFDLAFDECPASHVSIYQYGPSIVGWQIANEKDPVKKEKLLERLMSIYDGRITFFGNSPRYGKAYILGRKAGDYMRFADPKKDPLKENAYKWLSEAIELEKGANEASVFQNHFVLASNMYKAKPDAFKETYISDYLKVTPMLSERAASGDPKDTIYAAVKTMVDAMFAQSGVADCKTLDNVYGSQLNGKQKDKKFLDVVLALYRIADCEDSKVYFEASDYAHKIEPTAGSASGLAVQAYNNKEYRKAITYFEEAVKLESSNAEKSKLKMKVAAIYNTLNDYENAREASRVALNFNPSNSSAYIMIAHLYAQYASKIDDDPVIQKTAYWAAVDKLEKAKSVDPSSAANVNKMISTYKANFPPKAELFMRNITGDTYTVPGWINEKTAIR
ncbi:MAG: hypothetical protein LBR52_04840 [Prevotellaceae bacterium]|jgi:tetratricopeptide (TPR) repeat protein|nr:hypothetical protein [Prevotellaceae bacterium]